MSQFKVRKHKLRNINIITKMKVRVIEETEYFRGRTLKKCFTTKRLLTLKKKIARDKRFNRTYKIWYNCPKDIKKEIFKSVNYQVCSLDKDDPDCSAFGRYGFNNTPPSIASTDSVMARFINPDYIHGIYHVT